MALHPSQQIRSFLILLPTKFRHRDLHHFPQWTTVQILPQNDGQVEVSSAF